MITFKTFLYESFTPTTLSSVDAERWINRNAPSYIDNLLANDKLAIFRGMKLHVPFGTIDTNGFRRTAANTGNYVNLWTSSDSTWADYPKRESSYICSSFASTAEGYGSPFLVIPADSAHIGICPAFDFWVSFPEVGKKTGVTLPSFNTLLRMLSESLPYRIKGVDFSSAATDFAVLEKLLMATTPEILEGYPEYDVPQNTIKLMEKHSCKNLHELFKIIFDPKAADFSHIKARDYRGAGAIDREVWVQGKVLLLNLDLNDHTDSEDERPTLISDLLKKFSYFG